MSDGGSPLLLQVCPNDHPPFADICRFHAAAAAERSWETATIMLARRTAERVPAFHYVGTTFADCAAAVLGGRQPVLTLCHRYRAWRAVMGDAGLRAPVVAVAHEFGLLRRRRRRWLHRLDRLRGRPPVTFAGVSDAVRDELAMAVGEAVVLPNGIDLAQADALRLPRAAARAELALPAGGFQIGVVGRLHPKKRPDLALAAFAAAARQLPEARLVFVGDGELGERLRRRAAGLPVTFAGFRSEAAKLMGAFDLLLVASGEREAFGVVALEAMAAGVVVLSGPAPGPRFVVGEAGLRFEDDGVETLAHALLDAYRRWQSGRLAALARRARERVEREFSVTAAGGRLEALTLSQ